MPVAVKTQATEPTLIMALLYTTRPTRYWGTHEVNRSIHDLHWLLWLLLLRLVRLPTQQSRHLPGASFSVSQIGFHLHDTLLPYRRVINIFRFVGFCLVVVMCSTAASYRCCYWAFYLMAGMVVYPVYSPDRKYLSICSAAIRGTKNSKKFK